jgi:peptidoglycan hydrolase-like protein with peptidoglycan-binding domain
LKDQGFYYGEITGRKDGDTTAAIRRYQIRNGLKITGELDSETQRSLRITGGGSMQPRIPPQQRPADDNPDLRDDEPRSYQPPSQYRSPRDAAPPFYAPEPYRYRQETSGIFDGTPYETASIDVQQRIIFDAQIFLARRGYYRSEIDGIYGPGTEFALRAFQSRIGLPPTGRLDAPTLGALGLAPGQRVPGRRFPPRRFPRPVYRGQWIPN